MSNLHTGRPASCWLLLCCWLAACSTPRANADLRMAACPDLWRTKAETTSRDPVDFRHGLRENGRTGELLPAVYQDVVALSPKLLALREPGEQCFTFRAIEGEVDARRLGRSWSTPFTIVHPAPLLLGVRPADTGDGHVISVLRADGDVAGEVVGSSDVCWGLPGAVVWRRSDDEGVVISRADGRSRELRQVRFVPTGRNKGRLMHSLSNGLLGLLDDDGNDWTGGVSGYVGMRGIDWGGGSSRRVGNDAWLLVSRGADGRERLGFVSGDFERSLTLQHWLSVETSQATHAGDRLKLLIAQCEDGTWELVRVSCHDGADGRVEGLVCAFYRLGSAPERAGVTDRLNEHLAGIERQRREQLAADQAERDRIDEHVRLGNHDSARELARRWGGDVRAKYQLRWPGKSQDVQRALEGTHSPGLRARLTELLQRVEREEEQARRDQAARLAAQNEADRRATLRMWGDALVDEWQRGTRPPTYDSMSLSEQWFGRTVYQNGVAHHVPARDIEDRNHERRMEHERRQQQYGSLEQFLRSRLGGSYDEYVKLGGASGR